MSDVVSFEVNGISLSYSKKTLDRHMKHHNSGPNMIIGTMTSDAGCDVAWADSSSGIVIIAHYKEHHAPKPEMRPFNAQELFGLHKLNALFRRAGDSVGTGYLLDGLDFSDTEYPIKINSVWVGCDKILGYTLDGETWHECKAEV